MKKIWLWSLLGLVASFSFHTDLFADDCFIEGDEVKFSARVWVETTDAGSQWAAQLDKPVCVWGIDPKNNANYKISDTVMLVKLEADNDQVREVLKTESYSRAVFEGKLGVNRSGNSRLKCIIHLTTLESAEEGEAMVSKLLQRDNATAAWVMRASSELKEMLSRQAVVENIGKEALAFIHPLSNYEGVNSWSVGVKGRTLNLNMRVLWTGKLTSKLYSTDILWKSNQQGHISAEITEDGSRLPITGGKKEKLDDYFRTQVWPMLYNRLK